MAALRALLVFVTLIGFFLIGTPLQWLVVRALPQAANVIPILFCRSLLGLLRVGVAVTGDPSTDGPVLIVANHISWIDILALGGLMPFCFLAKSEVASWPIVSAFAEVQGTVFVDRRRRRNIPEANRDMAARMLEGRAVLLFPEATTLAGPLPGRFHTSHFAAVRDLLRLAPERGPAAVQPVAIAYSSSAAAWVGDDDLLSHLWQTLRGAPLTCSIAFGAPIACVAGADRKVIAQATREAIIGLIEARTVTSPASLPSVADLRHPASTGC